MQTLTQIEEQPRTVASTTENRRFNSVSSHHLKPLECNPSVTKRRPKGSKNHWEVYGSFAIAQIGEGVTVVIDATDLPLGSHGGYRAYHRSGVRLSVCHRAAIQARAVTGTGRTLRRVC